ncbi:hypothetical protein [Deinococcus hopiensis]|uniref:Uncharacterized protein n=1 Tax=Deinococcus hopiensis KR-140 TaxID=695939 RepID=A0A1W1UL95_9DEIO|nr:hypothetical protein [Deinococcus hopiensis]SMB81832.1 hypothetical protein SAMN00790413_04737 [Deinococcus hopiensis KR-140]
MKPLRRFAPSRYEIQVDGHLDASHSEWLGQLTLCLEFRRGRAVTSLRGALADQSALYGVLGMLQTMGVVLLEVIRLEDPE